MPSPHTVVQTLGSPLHVQPGSKLQPALQPSPSAVFPSSQSRSPAASLPSPQVDEHTLGSPPQV